MPAIPLTLRPAQSATLWTLARFVRLVESRAAGIVVLLLSTSLACQKSATTAPPPVQRYAYAPAVATRSLHFPADHGPHRDAAYEWWYFTGHILTEPSGTAAPTSEQAGFEVTVFRISPPAGPLAAAPAAQRPEQASFLSLHVAVTDLAGRTFRHQTLGLRERTGVAAVATRPGPTGQALAITVPGATVTLDADGRRFRIDAELRDDQNQPLQVHATLAAEKPVTLHGAGGYSRKGDCPSCASHYSSFPRLRGTATVRSVSGERTGPAQAWFDHEFGSNALGSEIFGWDWLAVQLDDGWELMAAQTRDAAGRTVRRSGTLISPQGEVTTLTDTDLELSPSGQWTSPHSEATYPARWRVQVHSPVHPLDAELVPKLADQEIAGAATALATYWEGTCAVLIGKKSAGASYVEMTGYDSHHPPRL